MNAGNNHFLSLKIWGKDRLVAVRPEAVVAVQQGDEEFDVVVLVTGDTYWVERGQFALSMLINHTSHAGMRVL